MGWVVRADVGPAGVEGVRAMKARHTFHRTWVGVLSCVLLLQAACTTDGSSDSSGAPSIDAEPTATEATTSDGREAAEVEPAPCRSEQLRSWAVGEIGTRRLVARGESRDVVVSRNGTATVAWSADVDWGEVRTMDDPAAPGDPQSPAGPPDPQHREGFGGLHGWNEDVLGIDAGGVQTLLWLSDERGPAPGCTARSPSTSTSCWPTGARVAGGRVRRRSLEPGTSWPLGLQLTPQVPRS